MAGTEAPEPSVFPRHFARGGDARVAASCRHHWNYETAWYNPDYYLSCNRNFIEGTSLTSAHVDSPGYNEHDRPKFIYLATDPLGVRASDII